MSSTRMRCLSLGLLLMSAAGAGRCHDLVIHAGTLIDGVVDSPRRQVSILIRDDRIVSVESGFVSPAGAEVVDLSDSTVMPGFIDCHVHISAMLPGRTNATEYWLTHSDIDRGLDAAMNVRQLLQQGFTAARDVGGGDETVSVRNAVNEGKIRGRGSGSRWSRWVRPPDTAIPGTASIPAFRIRAGIAASSTR